MADRQRFLHDVLGVDPADQAGVEAKMHHPKYAFPVVAEQFCQSAVIAATQGVFELVIGNIHSPPG